MSVKRAALYAVGVAPAAFAKQPFALVACAQHARRLGYRVVVMSHEGVGAADHELGGPRLRSLIERMGAGEFDVIVAKPKPGKLLMIEAVTKLEDSSQ